MTTSGASGLEGFFSSLSPVINPADDPLRSWDNTVLNQRATRHSLLFVIYVEYIRATMDTSL